MDRSPQAPSVANRRRKASAHKMIQRVQVELSLLLMETISLY